MHAGIEYGAREPIWSVKVNDQQDTPVPIGGGWELCRNTSRRTQVTIITFSIHTHIQCTIRRRGPVDASRRAILLSRPQPPSRPLRFPRARVQTFEVVVGALFAVQRSTFKQTENSVAYLLRHTWSVVVLTRVMARAHTRNRFRKLVVISVVGKWPLVVPSCSYPDGREVLFGSCSRILLAME